jgi:hypothetical protein
VEIKSTPSVDQVWKSVRLVILLFIPPQKDLKLNNVLYVPEASKNLVSVHRLTSDNNVFLEFHPNLFFVKDRATRKTLLEGRCE